MGSSPLGNSEVVKRRWRRVGDLEDEGEGQRSLPRMISFPTLWDPSRGAPDPLGDRRPGLGRLPPIVIANSCVPAETLSGDAFATLAAHRHGRKLVELR